MKKLLFSFLVIVFYSHSGYWNEHDPKEVVAGGKELSKGYLLGLKDGLKGIKIHVKGHNVRAPRL